MKPESLQYGFTYDGDINNEELACFLNFISHLSDDLLIYNSSFMKEQLYFVHYTKMGNEFL